MRRLAVAWAVLGGAHLRSLGVFPAAGEGGVEVHVNLAHAIPKTRFSALLLDKEDGLGLEGRLREHGCSVLRASSRAAARQALDHADLVVISAAGFPDDDVLDVVSRALHGSTVVVATDRTDLAVKAARLGAGTILGSSAELAAAQLGQALSLVEMKRTIARHDSAPAAAATTPGASERPATPLPTGAAPEALTALTALIEAAQALVPMHRFQRVYVDYALRRFGDNKVHTAVALGIDRRTIQRWARARAGAREESLSPSMQPTQAPS